MPTRTEILTILLLFLISIIVASYLDKHVLNILPDELASYFEIKLFGKSDSDNELKANEGISDKNDVTSDINAKFSSSSEPLDSYIPLVHGNRYHCSNDKNPIGMKPVQRVYSWVDEDGVTNLSDRKPTRRQAGIKIIDIDSIELDYFDINISFPGGGINTDISNEIRRSATQFYKILASLIGLNSMGRSVLNVYIYNDNTAFQEYKINTSSEIDVRSPGFYNPSSNIAAVLHSGDIIRTTKTALHEVAHVINHSSFGRIPSWLNEGLAEYFENFNYNNTDNSISSNRAWMNLIRTMKNKITLAELFNDQEVKWRGNNRTYYYAYSWALVYFLMEPGNREYLADLLYEISSDKCDVTDSTLLFNKIYPGGVNQLQSDWNKYLGVNKNTHKF